MMFRNKLTLRRVFTLFIVLFSLLGSACTSFGPSRLISSDTAYNNGVQLAVTREVLVNIVRSRYSDPMQFISVSAINAQWSVSVDASAGVGGLFQSGTAGDAGASVGYSDSPTITYVPLSDAAFYKALYSPFDVSETVGFGLAYRFAQLDLRWQTLSLLFSFSKINDAYDFVGGQYNKLYTQRVDAIVRLIELGASYEQVPEWDFNTISSPKAKVTAEDYVAAFDAGLYFIEEDGGENVRLARYRSVVALKLPDPDRHEVLEALKDLGVKPGSSRYVLRPPMHASPGFYDPYAIWVSPRSMGDVIGLATRFVDVPAEHSGIVLTLDTVAAKAWLPSVRIQSSKEEPQFPYRIQHRGYWFYVDDSDLESKIFLEALVAVYSSRVGSKRPDDAPPQIVIPAGG
jgi:hypothetical protein